MGDQNTIYFTIFLMSQNYDASQIKVLEGLEPVRQRPWMYIWSTDIKGLHHLIQEIVDNAVDESLGWFCTHITTVLHNDGSVTVFDNGRWIPVDKHPKTGKSALETVFTVLHAGGKFDKGVYKISWGLHGVGASVVNALSERLEVRVHKDGKLYRQSYKRGVTDGELEVIGETTHSWTTVRFKPDKTIFETVEFQQATELSRMKHGAYLTPWVTFTLVNEKTKLKKRFCFDGWIKTRLQNLVAEQKTIGNQFDITAEGDNIAMDICFQYVDSSTGNIFSFVNNIPTPDGWTHELWFKSALLSVINEIALEKELIDKKIGEFTYGDITDGLYAIVTVKVPEPQFQGQTKGRLWNSYVRTQVEKIVYDHLKNYFAHNEEAFDLICQKIMLSAKARFAAKMAKETVLRKNALMGWVLPGKLSDCSRKGKKNTELYIVEGNSAWGSAKQGRDSSFQAILPLRGKILNTEQALIDKILENKEVKSLILAIWAGIKENFDLEWLRYEKIIIMTDADVDGAHIRTLLLTFFFRYMKPLIDHGHLYIAVPPIYKFKQGKKEEYIYPPIEDTIDQCLSKNWFEAGKTSVQRYKGLGEMNAEQLRETTMDPSTRKMLQVKIEDAEEADRLFRILMGKDVASRKHFILTRAKTVKELDV